MRTWDRARLGEVCGRCGREISRGDPIQAIRLGDVNARMLRGVCCAEGEPPDDLPELAPAPPPRPRRRRFARPVRDWKVRQSGEEG